MFLYALIALTIGLLSLLHYLQRSSRTWKLLSKMPGPSPLPIIGNMLEFRDRSQRGMWLTVRRLSNLYRPICSGWALTKPFINVRHPDDMEVILSNVKCSHKEFPYQYLRPWLNNGLLTNRGDTYKNRRRMLTPAFHFNMLKRYVGIMNHEADKLMTRLKSMGDAFAMDIMPLYADISLNIIIESAMGIDLEKTDRRVIEGWKEAVEDMGEVLIYRMMRPYLPDWLLMSSLTKIGRKQQRALKLLHDFTDKIVRERREYHAKSQSGRLLGFKEFTEKLENESENIYTMGYKKKLPMLDLLLSAERDGLIDEQGIREEVDTFLLGGTDTTRMVMSYFTMLIAENEEAQEKARAEAVEVLDSCGGYLDMTEFQQFPYLEMCLKESLRIYPIASSVFRYTTDDVQLKEYTVPAGVMVVCNIIDTHHDPDFWPDPIKFDPDRFLPDNCRNRHPFAYVPFSAGPRNCIGQKFGWMELKATCARLLYNFKLEPIDRTRDLRLVGDIVLKPDHPVRVKFTRIRRD